MSTESPPKLMTAEEFLKLPERKTIDRWLIRGELVERKKMTYRSFRHCAVLTNLVFLLEAWLRSQSAIRATLLSGDMGYRLRKNPDSIVGIDATIALESTPIYRQGRREILDGPPLLAIEITSLSDRQEDIDGKVEEYLQANVSLVWIVNPTLKTIAVYRPDAEPQLFTLSSEMTAEPHLPGLRFKVADVFAKMPAVQNEETQG